METRKTTENHGFERGVFRHAVLVMSHTLPLGGYGYGASFSEGAVLLRFKQAGWIPIDKAVGKDKMTLTLESPACRSSRTDEMESCIARAKEMADLYGWEVGKVSERDGAGSDVFGKGDERDLGVPARWYGPGMCRTIGLIRRDGQPCMFVAGSPVRANNGKRAFRMGFILPDGGYEMRDAAFFGYTDDEAFAEARKTMEERKNG